MNLLAFDTCFGACSVAVCRVCGTAGERVFARFELMSIGHAERLVPMIRDVLAEAELTVADLARIGVTHGPGSFAGTRIGLAAARALSLTCRADVLGFSSLAVMARRVARVAEVDCDIGIAVDVRRDEVYAQVYDPAGRVSRCEPLVCSPGHAATFGGSRPILWAGTGCALIATCRRDQELPVSVVESLGVPDARDLLDLLAGVPVGADPSAERSLAPRYLRPPDAKPSAAASLMRQ
jgi:tRNA threonylcarbamoyladenosine biosynthesis protein TsaB